MTIVQKVGLFDFACPDVQGEYRYQAQLSQHALSWKDDYRIAREDIGLSAIRIGVPWPFVQSGPHAHNWFYLDERFDHAESLGLEVILALTQFSWPLWIDSVHPVRSPRLPAHFAEYAEAVCMRYAGRFSEAVPVIEIGTDAYSRVDTGVWGPHAHDRSLKAEVELNLMTAFNAAAKVFKDHGVRVLSHEAANRLDIALQLDADEIGIDHYTHAGFPSFCETLRTWHAAFKAAGRGHPVFSLLERGAPETYDLTTRTYGEPGGIENRRRDIRYYQGQVEIARAEGISVRKVGTFVIGNLWTDERMELDSPDRECDRNALVDLYRREDGTLERRVQEDLVRAFRSAFS